MIRQIKCIIPIALSNMGLALCLIFDGCILLVTLGIVNPCLAVRWLEKEQAQWLHEIQALSIQDEPEEEYEPMIVVVPKPSNGGDHTLH